MHSHKITMIYTGIINHLPHIQHDFRCETKKVGRCTTPYCHVVRGYPWTKRLKKEIGEGESCTVAFFGYKKHKQCAECGSWRPSPGYFWRGGHNDKEGKFCYGTINYKERYSKLSLTIPLGFISVWIAWRRD